MFWILYVVCILIGLFALVLLASFICYRLVFVVPKYKSEEIINFVPKGEQYDIHRDTIRQMIESALTIPYEDVWINSFDGYKLHAKYYHAADGAPLQISIPGYRSAAELDFSGGLRFSLDSGFNMLLVDQRAQGESGGKCLTFGVKERYDCVSWVNYAVERFGKDVKIILYGMSMGAATVLMASALSLPDNVRGLVADCGYTSPPSILKKVIKDLHCPVWLIYPLLHLGGRVFGGFNTEDASATEASSHCNLPVLFIHGKDDHFVPCDMSRENFRACASCNKRLLVIPTAGHGMSFFADKELYLSTVNAFFNTVLK